MIMDVKHVSIVFGQTYVNDALLTIKSTKITQFVVLQSDYKKLSDCKK